jgi:hypothetical protein
MSKQQPMSYPIRKKDETASDYLDRLEAWRREDARSKGDLREWTGCPPFHLNREPV